jgi:hypothetical protein
MNIKIKKRHLSPLTHAMERDLIRGGNNGIPDLLFSACCSNFSSCFVITNISPKEMVKRLEINIKDMLEMGVKRVD